MSSASPIEVAIVEDDRSLRHALRALIGGTDGFRVVGTWGSVEEAIVGLRPPGPDVLLLDIRLPGRSGADGVAGFRTRVPRTTIVMLTSFDEDDLIFRSICNGASGYLLKRTPPSKLLDAIAEAGGGGAPMSPGVARKVVDLFRRAAPPSPQPHALTPQEIRLLGLLAEGHTYETAGDELGVSINTVRNYVRSVYEKLHVHSKSEAVGKALRAGII